MNLSINISIFDEFFRNNSREKILKTIILIHTYIYLPLFCYILLLYESSITLFFVSFLATFLVVPHFYLFSSWGGYHLLLFCTYEDIIIICIIVWPSWLSVYLCYTSFENLYSSDDTHSPWIKLLHESFQKFCFWHISKGLR